MMQRPMMQRPSCVLVRRCWRPFVSCGVIVVVCLWFAVGDVCLCVCVCVCVCARALGLTFPALGVVAADCPSRASGRRRPHRHHHVPNSESALHACCQQQTCGGSGRMR